MSFAKKHNTLENPFIFNTPATFDFVKPKDLVVENGLDKVYLVKAMFINTKSEFGHSPNVVTDFCIISAPNHMLDTIKEVIQDSESVSMINKGLVGVKIYTYKNRYGTQYGLEWVDIDPDTADKIPF